MTSRGVFGSVLVSLALVVGTVGCGVEAGDDTVAAVATTTGDATTTTADPGEESPTTEADEPTDTTEGEDDEPTTTEADEPSETMPSETMPSVPGGLDIHDAMVDAFVSAGFTPEQADCLATEYEDMGITTGGAEVPDDPSAYLEVFDQCGISLADLGKLGGAGG